MAALEEMCHSPKPMRIVHCQDAIEWLQSQQDLEGASFFVSLPDFSEFPSLTLDEWKCWFVETAALIISKTGDSGVTLFFQSDIKHDGHWIDKSYLCQKAAESQAVQLLFHKVFCRAPPGVTTYGKPSYSHLLCFSKNLKADVSLSTPDVFQDVGDKSWTRGTGIRPARVACEFILRQTESRLLVNPFCGEGGILAVANSLGLCAVGIERSPKRAEKARRMALTEDGDYYVE